MHLWVPRPCSYWKESYRRFWNMGQAAEAPSRPFLGGVPSLPSQTPWEQQHPSLSPYYGWGPEGLQGTSKSLFVIKDPVPAIIDTGLSQLGRSRSSRCEMQGGCQGSVLGGCLTRGSSGLWVCTTAGSSWGSLKRHSFFPLSENVFFLGGGGVGSLPAVLRGYSRPCV